MSDETVAWLPVQEKWKLFAYGPVNATATVLPVISCYIMIQNGSSFCFQLVQVVLEKRPLIFTLCTIANSYYWNWMC